MGNSAYELEDANTSRAETDITRSANSETIDPGLPL